MAEKLNKAYWEARWLNNQTGWDIGAVSTPLKTYFDQLTNKQLKILIPGCGNAYEGEYLIKNGFENTFLIDISSNAALHVFERFTGLKKSNFFVDDFFNHQGTYDLIIEQTFFCALHPSQRKLYVEKMHQLLSPNGKLVGVLFNDQLNSDFPPFGGFLEDYKSLFSELFSFKTFEMCKNSIKPRQGRELFINLKKL